ncbi:uncharacterized protein PITG_15838 [Phytophthora infestans T30-4]|uniref:Uncharacterized protein n=1 Tax=Phytophthora infestans (strain T30-4) TaxID=403677 RepID=D0NRV0_PHYIT|nr:uncharacterized protein PITG_15838 [Phytophthora infestans T30-4]EEY63491.1 conserved hypothetical protein [Phytophthora infestans T30-4]|eukprot:XP_002898078.1 conserved hypothetical protein [Phytophthora infestans T30-4]
MRLPASAALDLDDHPNQRKHSASNPEEIGEELYVGEDGLISVSPVDAKSQIDKLKQLLDRREKELRQAAEYGLGLLQANDEMQMEVATLKIQLETETEELSVERDMWQRRTEHAQQETAQWKRKFARVEEEKTELAEDFEQFVDRCECRGFDTGVANSGGRYSHHLDTIAQLQTELHALQAIERSNEAELASLRLWKQVAEHQQQEALECEALAAQSEVSYREKMEAERAATQRAMKEVKHENDSQRTAAQKHEEEMKSLKKQLRLAEEARDDAQVHSNELRETLLSSESRCKRLQRELELLEHVSYFSQAIVDQDDEESDSDDEIIEEKDLKTVVSAKPSIDTKTDDCDAEDPAMPSPLGIKRRRSFLAANAVPYSPFPRSVVAEDGEQVTVSKSELETHKKLHHYFHLTALSIINENNLHERCFSSSSRLTIDMWYREISAKEVPFLMWHSWLINRISEVAASVQDEDKMPQPPTSSSKHPSFGGAFHGFSLRKKSDSGENGAKNALPSPPTASPGASPVARVPFTVARAFFRLLRKRTHAGADSSQVNGSPVSGSPAG